VYGNILIEPAGAYNRQIVHYGGDNGNTAYYRKGTLLFYNNTVVSKRPDATVLFRLSTNEETCNARNNIFYTSGSGTTMFMIEAFGRLELSRNWFKTGRRICPLSAPPGAVFDDGSSIESAAPGFANESDAVYSLTATSPAIDAGGVLDPRAIYSHPVSIQYVKHRAYVPRVSVGLADLGAFESKY
jgi:hypothetical protein